MSATIETLTAADLANFAKLGISEGTLALARIERVTNERARETYGLQFDGDLSGILFPYFLNGARVTARVRRDHPERGERGEPQNKYVSAFGDRRHLYVPPDYEALLADPSVPLIFVEAEKSVLAIWDWSRRRGCKVLPLGCGGCWGWKGKVGVKITANGDREEDRGPLPEVGWASNGRTAVLLFDENCATNAKVQAAREALRKQLTHQGASVILCNLPALEGINGPDDYLATFGDAEFTKLLQGPEQIVSAEDSWPEPRELQADLPAVPPFPLDYLPTVLREFVLDLSEQMQVPVDIPAAALIVSLAGCVGHRAEVQPKILDTRWKESLNLFGAVVAPPGFMKSPVLKLVTAPLETIQQQWLETQELQREQYEQLKHEHEMRLQVWEAAWKAAQRAGTALPPRPDDTIWKPGQRRLLLSDSTFEKLHEILSDNPGGVFVVRDELSGFLADFEKQGRESEKAFWLQAWNGRGGFTIDRIGRGTVHVPNVCASLYGNFVPSKIRYLLQNVLNGGPADDGFFQRIQILVWPDVSKEWKYIDRLGNSRAADAIERVCRSLTNLSGNHPLQLRFGLAAQELFVPWLTELERRIRGGSLSPVMTGHVSKYRKLMPVLAGIFELVECAQRGDLETFATPAEEFTLQLQPRRRITFEEAVPVESSEAHLISAENATRSIALCEYFEAHARRVYSCVITPEILSAHELARHIRNGDVQPAFSSRSVYIRGWSSLDTAEKVEAAIAVLEDAEWLRPVRSITESRSGGRPSPKWEINPRIK